MAIILDQTNRSLEGQPIDWEDDTCADILFKSGLGYRKTKEQKNHNGVEVFSAREPDISFGMVSAGSGNFEKIVKSISAA